MRQGTKFCTVSQDAGENGRGRRSSDRGAYQRFHKALLEKRVVELGIVERASDTTIQRTLKKRA